MRILHIGDVVGEGGCRCLMKCLPELKKYYSVDLCIVNGENSAPGNGIDKNSAEMIFAAGADVITNGNHVWQRQNAVEMLEDNPSILRPSNYPNAPGNGVCVVDCLREQAAVVCLMGRLTLDNVDDPFRHMDTLLKDISCENIFVDFHAEATSEKAALAYYLDGRVSSVVGTHTHVQTADARILQHGTAFISDVGMTGPVNSVIGADVDMAIQRFLTSRPTRFVAAKGPCAVNGVFIQTSGGHAVEIEPFIKRE